MKLFKFAFLSLSLFALAACGVEATPTISSKESGSSETQSSEDNSSTINPSSSETSSSEETTTSIEPSSSEAEPSGGGTEPSGGGDTEPKKEPLSTFDEINSKMDMVKKAIGSTVTSDEKQASDITPSAPTLSAPIIKKALVKKAPDPEYTEFINNGWSPNSIYEDYQTIDYIVNITNYLHNNLSNGSYGTTLEYGKLYKGEGYMELTRSLNVAMKAYSLPAPTLSVVFTKTGNNLECFANWNYASEAMKSAVPIWNIKILTHITFVFNNDQELEQVYVAYLFDGIQFQIESALFDFKNLTYYSYHSFNGSDQPTYDSNYDTAKAICDERYAEISSGAATKDNLPRCHAVRVTKINISDSNISDDDIQFFRRETNSRFKEDGDLICETPDVQEDFKNLYEEVYNKVQVNSFILEYNYENPTVVNSIVEDGAVFALWRSVIIYDYNASQTVVAFIGYDDLRKYLAELKAEAEEETKTLLDSFLEAVEASEEKYTGCVFKKNADTYTLKLSDGAYEETRLGQEGSYYTFGAFSYALYKNEDLILRFSVSDDGHATVAEPVNNNLCNIILTDGAIQLVKNKYLYAWITWNVGIEHHSALVPAAVTGDRGQFVTFEATNKLVNVIIGIYSEQVTPDSFDDLVAATYNYQYLEPPTNLVALIWLHDWGTFARNNFLESTRSNGIEYNTWMGVFYHVSNGYMGVNY